MPDTSYTSASQATRMRHKWHKCNTSDTNSTQATRVQHKSNTSATQTTRVQHENFDFDNNTNKNIFSLPYIYYMASERLQGEEQFHSKNYTLEMPRSHIKMRLKSAPQKLNFLMEKDISKSYTLDCSCTLMPLHVPA